MANRNRSTQPYNGNQRSNDLQPYGASNMMQMMQRQHEEMNKMSREMMRGFGFDDPFKDDPFFSGSGMMGGFGGFGDIDKMFSGM